MNSRGNFLNPVPSNITLQHVDFKDIYSYGFDGLTINQSNSHGAKNGPNAQLFDYRNSVYFPAANLIITNSWFHSPASSTTDAHIETLHLGGISNITIRNNILDERAPDARTLGYTTSVLNIGGYELYGMPSSNVIIDNNRIFGGGYFQLYIVATGDSAVTNNAFVSTGNAHFAGIQYPPSAYSLSSLPGGKYMKFAQSGNTLDGNPVVLPGGK